MNNHHARDWLPFEGGQTIGQTGAEGGVIIRDDEHPDGARITLEQGCLNAPFAITCGVYGWAVHSRFLADDETAQHAFDAMRGALSGILALVPREDDPDMADKSEAVADAIAAFVERYP
jgi:hypothetical protein